MAKRTPLKARLVIHSASLNGLLQGQSNTFTLCYTLLEPFLYWLVFYIFMWTFFGWKGLNWLNPAQDGKKWRPLVNTVTNTRVLENVGNSSIKWETISFPKITLLYGIGWLCKRYSATTARALTSSEWLSLFQAAELFTLPSFYSEQLVTVHLFFLLYVHYITPIPVVLLHLKKVKVKLSHYMPSRHWKHSTLR